MLIVRETYVRGRILGGWFKTPMMRYVLSKTKILTNTSTTTRPHSVSLIARF